MDAAALAKKVAPTNLILSLGVVDGRNIWKANYAQVLPVIKQVTSVLPADRIW
jgi:5-methyltetrahydropteroyltriglutamate--homocysteine methyltransferase